ncbi:MAG: hypothetical protein Q7R50_08300 [Dehalococcoidales bacterium]|nr:hypothetical protein [Dehalococcoidales bacterium]
MTLEQFQKKALKEFTKEITDIFFLYIESDEELMHDYLRIIGRGSNLDETNMALGAAVKQWFRLENGKVNQEPISKLIESYTEHIRK